MKTAAPLLSHCDRDAARPPQPNTATDCARVLCNAGRGSTTQFCNAFTGKRHGFEIYSVVAGVQEFKDDRDVYACE